MQRKKLSPIGRGWAAVVVLLTGATSLALMRWSADPRHELVSAANKLDRRLTEGRFAEPFEYRPLRAAGSESAAASSVRQCAHRLRSRWASNAVSDDGRLAADAFLSVGDHQAAWSILCELLQRGAVAADPAIQIQHCDDARLLIDFSAAALQRRGEGRSLVLAYEAADRAWRLSGASAAAWNRALAADRLGMYGPAVREWREAFERERSPGWRLEADERRRAAARRAVSPPETSFEMFFYRALMALPGESKDLVAGDHLVSDTAAWLVSRRSPKDRDRLKQALVMYVRGRDSFDRNEYGAAREAYAAAEAELDALRVPLVLIARDQRIRAECSEAMTGCLESMRAFRRDVVASGRYRWLAARAAYGEGQTLYRQGHVYEAADNIEHALAEFENMGDRTSVGFMHVLLGNVYAAAGESDLALRHFLEGLACRTAPIGDRRRKMLEDPTTFMLRHGYIATAELLLDEMAVSPATDASRVTEWMLRGIIAFRHGDAHAAAQHFERAHVLLRAVKDDSAREDAQFRLAIAEAGSRIFSTHPVIAELDAGIAAHQRAEFSVWLPQLLNERGAAYERMNELGRAEGDYRRAIELLESREPRIDQTVLALGVASEEESPFDRLIRLLLHQQRIAGALSVAQQSNALRISALHAHGAGLRDRFRPVPAGDGVVELRGSLRGDEVAVAHHLLRDRLITWIVSKERIVATMQPMQMENVVREAGRLRDCGRASWPNPGAVDRISGMLLRGWIDRVPRGATLLIQPPPELEGVPFSMLTTGTGERLVLRNAVATAPSFWAFARALRNDTTRARSVSAFFAAAPTPAGNLAPLPFTVSEALRASRYYVHRTVDTHATRARFLERAPAYSIVHFSGHVVVNAERPLFSALAFDGGDLLYVHELDDRSFAGARLVVLSGCESGRAPRPTMSIANALLSQGVPSVVYTLWPVSDEAAESFAVEFHREIAAGQTRAEAVRRAQLSLMRHSPNEPGAWAAFALAGAPDPIVDARKGERL